MFPRRLAQRRSTFALAAIVTSLGCAAGPVLAGPANATLVVGVTVVRSCAVGTVPLSQTTAGLNLRCTSGAASTVKAPAPTESHTESGTLRLLVPTTRFTGNSSGVEWRVATVNF